MGGYEKLLMEVENNVIVDDTANLPDDISGYYIETNSDNLILLNKNIECTKTKTCTLAEEIGHHYTTFGDISDQSKTENIKQEIKARRWAVQKLIVVEDFIGAFNAGVRNRYELSEFLGVTESFIEMALTHFKCIYGLYCQIDNYVVYFDPLSVLEIIE
ncbi:ImmA/IrrE family metallo-endopeptidase [Tissierella praeacuta]|uniref:ImmA/IrrE family metallo-endopeptidase n=1 Tax=Tissierella praeacuta TaxID=43131 RepID=UPI002FD8BA2F